MANLLYNLAQPFSDTKQYTQGAIVIYNDRMYEMTADEYTPGPFDPEKFTERFLSEMISGKLNSNLGNKIAISNVISDKTICIYIDLWATFSHSNFGGVHISGTLRNYAFISDLTTNQSGTLHVGGANLINYGVSYSYNASTRKLIISQTALDAATSNGHGYNIRYIDLTA